jgi:hypothetical protein
MRGLRVSEWGETSFLSPFAKKHFKGDTTKKDTIVVQYIKRRYAHVSKNVAAKWGIG